MVNAAGRQHHSTPVHVLTNVEYYLIRALNNNYIRVTGPPTTDFGAPGLDSNELYMKMLGLFTVCGALGFDSN